MADRDRNRTNLNGLSRPTSRPSAANIHVRVLSSDRHHTCAKEKTGAAESGQPETCRTAVLPEFVHPNSHSNSSPLDGGEPGTGRRGCWPTGSRAPVIAYLWIPMALPSPADISVRWGYDKADEIDPSCEDLTTSTLSRACTICWFSSSHDEHQPRVSAQVGGWGTLEDGEVTQRVAQMLRLFSQDHLQTPADDVLLIRVGVRRLATAYTRQLGIGEVRHHPAHTCHAQQAQFQHVVEGRSCVQREPEFRHHIGGHCARRKAQRVVGRLLLENRVAEPGVAGEEQMPLRLHEGPFTVDPLVQRDSGNRLAPAIAASQSSSIISQAAR